MRLLHILLSIYMLALTAMPCTDAEAANMQDICCEAGAAHDAGEESGPETCPPFCVCACCGTIPLPGFDAPHVEMLQPTQARRFTAIRVEVTKVTIPVWQPPRLPVSFVG